MSEPIDTERILFTATVLKQPYNNVELGIIATDLFGVQRTVTKKNATVSHLLHPKQLAVVERDNELYRASGSTRAVKKPQPTTEAPTRPVKKQATRTAVAAPRATKGTKGKEPEKELKMVKAGSRQTAKK